MKKYAALFLLSALLLLAQEISGGFGLKLGDTFDKNKAETSQETGTGDMLYEVVPPKKVKYFQKYYVMITPLSQKIREIWGIGYFTTMEECQNNMDVLVLIMEKKYGKFEKPEYATEQIRLKRMGDRDIIIKCTKSFAGGDLYLKYRDNTLNKTSKVERAEIESKSIDASAL
ncbi:hypothetical protein [Hydrogenimonas urashimensis]|uniref:hypothetical protein n=1 Tax=Hydrogenimonas urashimensis TaxID=2740515 RepID=UPI001915A35D|nr:hypothetical protein [Hydrogenimonas urashimensis]